ncbi:hypothetical protein, partial [Rhodococcus sp. EPR-157]|uniref:hypothetical protein n=1 Tax=Rhodococcus sp. EPR-157 TaxID=1813677 RepID=UPI0012E8179F
MRNRAGPRTAQICIGLLGTGAMLGIGSVSAPPSAGADIPVARASQAERALDAVATERGDRARTAIPTAFTERFYTP